MAREVLPGIYEKAELWRCWVVGRGMYIHVHVHAPTYIPPTSSEDRLLISRSAFCNFKVGRCVSHRHWVESPI